MSKIKKDNDAKQEKIKTIYNVYIIIRFNRRLNTSTAPSLYYIYTLYE